MDNLYYKVKLYLEANSKTETEFDSNILLQDDGSGPYIKTWNVSNVAKPTDSQLNALEDDANKLEKNNVVIEKRKSLYGSWDKQLEEINEQGLDAWKERIAQIKADNPKES